MHLERVIGCKHARIHTKPNDIAGRVANLKVLPTENANGKHGKENVGQYFSIAKIESEGYHAGIVANLKVCPT